MLDTLYINKLTHLIFNTTLQGSTFNIFITEWNWYKGNEVTLPSFQLRYNSHTLYFHPEYHHHLAFVHLTAYPIPTCLLWKEGKHWKHRGYSGHCNRQNPWELFFFEFNNFSKTNYVVCFPPKRQSTLQVLELKYLLKIFWVAHENS